MIFYKIHDFEYGPNGLKTLVQLNDDKFSPVEFLGPKEGATHGVKHATHINCKNPTLLCKISYALTLSHMNIDKVAISLLGSLDTKIVVVPNNIECDSKEVYNISEYQIVTFNDVFQGLIEWNLLLNGKSFYKDAKTFNNHEKYLKYSGDLIREGLYRYHKEKEGIVAKESAFALNNVKYKELIDNSETIEVIYGASFNDLYCTTGDNEKYIIREVHKGYNYYFPL